MSSTKTVRFLDIPEVVLFECILPKLSTNTLLRLRLICKSLKTHSDRFLSTKLPSKRKIHIFFEHDDEQCGIHFADFMEQDSASSLAMPSSSLYLEYIPDKHNLRNLWNNQLGNRLFTDFLLKYGRQIKSLKASCLLLPMVPGNPEFVLYENLPNLECLDVETIFIFESNDPCFEAVNLPRCFQELRSLDTYVISSETPVPQEHFWKFIELCRQLKRFRCPSVVEKTLCANTYSNASEKLSVFQNLNRLLLRESSKLKTLDLSYVTLCEYHQEADWKSLETFWENCANLGISFSNVRADFFGDFELDELSVIADNIRSIINISCDEDLKGVVFSNLDTLKVRSFTQGGKRTPFGIIKRRLSVSLFPNLKILKIINITTGDSKYWSKLWPRLSRLEELAFELGDSCGSCDLEDEAFFGDQVNSPPFLALKNLRKLSLDAGGANEHLHISTLVFFGVIRYMRLKELHIIGYLNLVNKYGILALASPGPFKESIEVFPFRNWSFGKGSQEEFHEMAKLFPTDEPY